MTQTAPYNGPLEGLNVLDFGWYYAGPLAGMMLADQGATVVRITKPGERELPDQQYRVFNRNKKLLELDLKTEEGKAQALSLIAKADVMIENFRPGVMARLGLDYASVKKVNPSIVYLSLPGFASTDKERRHLQAWEGVIGAATGLYTETSLFRQMLGFPPHYTFLPQASMMAGQNASIAVVAALVARETCGQGTVIEVPLFDAGMLGCMFYIYMKRPSFALRAIAPEKDELPEAMKPLVYTEADTRGLLEEKTEKARQLSYFGVTNRTYRCADRRDIYINAFDTTHLNGRIVRALGIEKQLQQEGFQIVGPWETGLDNNICSNAELSPERKARFIELMSEAFKKKSASEWEYILTKAGAMAAMVRTRTEWMALEPLQQSGLFTTLNEAGPELVAAGRVADVSDADGQLILGYREAAEISMAEALALFEKYEPPVVPKKKREPLKKGDLLKGVKVLDMANVAGGPISGHVLAEYGADVIKADPPYYLFPGLVMGSIPILAGKRSILTDVNTASGREILEKLIDWADVVQHNILDDTAKRLGVSQEQLKEINPDIVSCQFSAFGGTWRGGWEKRPGFDHTLHAASGLMAQYGDLDRPHPHGMVAAGDMMGGFCLAFAAVLGVYQQKHTGQGGECRTSLARALNYIQLPYMMAQYGQSDWGEARGQFSLGEGPCQRLYQCSDGWLFVGVTPEKLPHLIDTVAGRADASKEEWEKAFLAHSLDHWLSVLGQADIACHKVMSANDLYESAVVTQVSNEAADDTVNDVFEVLRWDDHPCGYPIVNVAPSHVRVGENRSYYRTRAAERLGYHTREVLAGLGYSVEEIDEFIRLGVSHEFLPALGSKEAFLFEPEASGVSGD